jgi:uncharacterized membrane protein
MKKNSFLAIIPLFSGMHAHSDHLSFQDVYPILEEKCLACHHNPGAPLGLSMETYNELLKGSQNGVVVIAGDPEKSELIRRIKGEAHPKMPFNGPPYLTELEIQLIASWIDAGLQNRSHH